MTPDPTPAGTTNGWLNWLVCTSCWLVIWTTTGFTRWVTVRTAVRRLSDDGAAATGLGTAEDATTAGLGRPMSLDSGDAADAVVGAAPVPAVAVVTGGGVALDGWVALEQAMLIGSSRELFFTAPPGCRMWWSLKNWASPIRPYASGAADTSSSRGGTSRRTSLPGVPRKITDDQVEAVTDQNAGVYPA